MARKNWSQEETMMAFALYFLLAPKECDKNNPEVINLANAIGRTPSSVSMKLWNIASNDSNRVRQGRVGLINASKLDAGIWFLFNEEGDDFLNRAIELLFNVLPEKELHTGSSVCEIVDLPEGKESRTTVATRANQQYFRNTLLNNYSARCCITGIDVESLLIASHIKPWSKSDPKTERLSPENGLLLNALHDCAFDRGYFTIDKNYKIIVSPQVKKNQANSEWLYRFEGQTIMIPKVHPPRFDYIEYHNDVVFLR